MSTTFKNPIIPGFAPDPSVCLVEDTFFLVNSSFQIFPGLPIYASKDLNSWKHIGNAINRTSQIDLSQAATDGFPIGPDVNLVAALGLFAPTIRWHKGVFYIICTSARRTNADDFATDNFYVTCTDIWADEWSDPIWFDFNGIDPSLFFDDDDRAYVQGSWREGSIADQKCSIRQFEIELSSGKPISDVQVLWGNGGKKSDIEGPHMYKKDGFYYLLVADGGTFEHHKAGIARSRNIWGPFEVYEKNPVLTADNTDEYVQHVGHADLFQDQRGTWWAVALGVRNEDRRFPMGRETFLIPVEWPTGEWPSFGRAKMEFQRDAPPAVAGSLRSPKTGARVDDVYIRNAKLDDYEFSADGNLITVIPRTNDMSAPKESTSFIGKRQRLQSCEATATLHVPNSKTTMAGFALYKDDFRHADICYDCNTRKVALKTFIKLKGGLKVVAERSVTTKTLQMRICATAQSYDFLIRDEKSSDWVSLGSIDALDMTACDFNGTIFGVWATTDEPAEGSSVQFEAFNVS